MKLQRLSTSICLVLGTVLAISNSAQAASFSTNVTADNYLKDSKGNPIADPESNIWLKSITQNGKTFSDFSLVNKAEIKSNTPISDLKVGDTSNPEAPGRNNSSGAASTDKGDKATSPISVSGINNPTGTEIAAFLGNKNLNNIIETEDTGSFAINLFFDSVIKADNLGVDNLLFWERGWNETTKGNSDLGIRAIDDAGKLIGNFLKLDRKDQTFAGYSIDTMEIDNTQKVGSWGVNLEQLGVTSLVGIQVTTNSSYNGPDFKVMARQSVPEPGTLLGLGVVTGLAFLRRRQSNQGSALKSGQN
ncbi:MAG: exosortase-dependent surface protein XDP2 [Heteroscytonema crispum UTEX LB 1556]